MICWLLCFVPNVSMFCGLFVRHVVGFVCLLIILFGCYVLYLLFACVGVLFGRRVGGFVRLLIAFPLDGKIGPSLCSRSLGLCLDPIY